MLWSLGFTVSLFHNVCDSIPPTEAGLYGHINWSLAQAHHECPLGLSQSSISMRGTRAIPKAGFGFNVQKWPVLASGGASLAQKPHFDTRSESHPGVRKSAWGASTNSIYLKQKGTMGDIVPDVLHSTSSSPSSSSVVQIGTLSNILDQWRSITFNSFE